MPNDTLYPLGLTVKEYPTQNKFISERDVLVIITGGLYTGLSQFDLAAQQDIKDILIFILRLVSHTVQKGCNTSSVYICTSLHPEKSLQKSEEPSFPKENLASCLTAHI